MLKRAVFIFLLIFGCFAGAKPFEGAKFVISGPSPHSPGIAQEIFKKGGNLVDMAVASALALAVTHPYYVSLGCGGFALLKMNSSIRALDFRETAPHKMSSDFFKSTGRSSQEGGAAVGAPGFIAGLTALHKKYGKLPWPRLVQPALSLAEKGFPVSGDWREFTGKSKKKFNSTGKNIFLKKGESPQPNEIFKQPRLAGALKLIQRQGRRAVYEGPIGRDMVSAVQKSRGLLEEEDLKKYRVRWLEPVSVSFRGYQVHSMPLPSSGGIILSRALKLMEKRKLYKQKLYSLNELHLLAEIMARAFWPRFLMGDPDFTKIREGQWLMNQDIEDMSKSIFLKKARRLPPPKESEETTHFSIIDAKGNALSMTLTLNGFYGSGLVSPKYGIVLNNQMDDFTTLPDQANMFGLIQGKNNSIQGGKRPLSSMSPTIVEKRGRTVMALGGAGGPTIITGVLQTLYRHLINKLDLEQAILAPRLHHQFLPRQLFVEDKRLNPELIVELKLRGHKIQFKNYIAQIFAVGQNPDGTLSGAHENRREGAAGGL